MRRLLTIAAVMGLTALPLMAVGGESVTLTAENVRVVIAKDAGPVVRFAADEMTNFLSRVLGAPVPIVHEVEPQNLKTPKPQNPKTSTPQHVNLVLGENAWSRAKGLEPEKQLKPDGFYILAEGDSVYLCGHDDPKADIRGALKAASAPQYGSQFHRSTLFAVYDFLERFAGVRFYFPGSDDLGIVTPRQTSVTVPAGKIVEEPYFDVVRRWTSPGSPRVDVGGGPEPEPKEGHRLVGQNNLLNMYRLRIKAVDFPNNHGACHLELQERFGKTHPEYFTLMKDSKGNLFRDSEPVKRGYPPCQVCWSSGITDELVKDAVAFARGDDPKTRGFKDGYPYEGLALGWFCFSPQDGFRECLCEKCQAGYDKSKYAYATEVVQSAVAKVGKGIQDAGVDMMILASAYTSYQDIPTCDMPSNVVMGVARTGPWAECAPKRRDKEFQDVVDWTKKTHQRVVLHNWACKYSRSVIPGLPALTPEAVGSYYERIAPYARGAYMESSSERRSHVYLNIYLYSKLAWNPKFDWRAALDEHDRLMFGAGAEPMRKIYRRLEDLWLNRICNNVIETSLSTVIMPPSPNEIWSQIYDDRLIAELRALEKEALEKVEAESEGEQRNLHLRRVKLLADDLIGSIAYAHDAYATEHSVAREEAYRKASKSPNLLADLKPNDYHFVRRAGEPDRCSVTPKIELKGETKYRLSAFVKFKDVEPLGKIAGVYVNFWDYAHQKQYAAAGGLIGSSDWISVSTEFVTLKDPEMRFLTIRLRNATGEAWIRDVRLEEVR